MPDEAVAYDHHAVALAEIHEGIGVVPEVHALFGMYLLAFHHVLGHDAVEMVAHHLGAGGVDFLGLVVVYGYAHAEFVAEHVLESGVGHGGHGSACAESGKGKEGCKCSLHDVIFRCDDVRFRH